MFYLDKNTALTPALLSKMINRFRVEEEPKLQRYYNYYIGQQNILSKYYVDTSKPCNRTVINYCQNITNSYSGYMASPGFISYHSDNDIEEIMDILRYNDYQEQDAAYLHSMLVYSRAAELMYHDEEGKTRFRLITPTTCFGVYDDTLSGDLIYFVRMYKASDWDGSEEYLVDVYDDVLIKHYKMIGNNGTPIYINEEPHNYSQIPANIAYMPDEKSIFDCIMSKQDSINELVSAEMDEINAFCDAYLVFEGAEIDDEDAQRMKTNRVLQLPEGAKAYWLTKNTNNAQLESNRKFLHDSIYRDAQCPDFSSDSFTGGVASGISIQYKLTGMETKAAVIEAIFKKALQRRIEILCGEVSLKLGEEVFRDVEIKCKRNIPDDINASVNLVNSLKGSVSDATLLSQLPFITDVNAEIEAVQKQKQENIELYGFGVSEADSEDEEE